VKRTRLKPIGKVGRETAKSMKDETPYLCRRAGGEWCGWTGERCVGAKCEYCGAYADDFTQRAHAIGRGRQGVDDRTNMAVLCLTCHTDLDNERVPGMRERLLAIVKERNERMEAE